MMNELKKNSIFNDVNSIRGVGKQLSTYLDNKKIEKIKDILLNFPYSETDRSKIVKLDKTNNHRLLTLSLKQIQFLIDHHHNLHFHKDN